VPRHPFRPVGPIGIALTAWDIWRRIPPRQRRQMLDLARKHGPRIASRAMQARANRKNRPR
jgi:hypothetical protein